jgi:hypothetical protein
MMRYWRWAQRLCVCALLLVFFEVLGEQTPNQPAKQGEVDLILGGHDHHVVCRCDHPESAPIIKVLDPLFPLE